MGEGRRCRERQERRRDEASSGRGRAHRRPASASGTAPDGRASGGIRRRAASRSSDRWRAALLHDGEIDQRAGWAVRHFHQHHELVVEIAGDRAALKTIRAAPAETSRRSASPPRESASRPSRAWAWAWPRRCDCRGGRERRWWRPRRSRGPRQGRSGARCRGAAWSTLMSMWAWAAPALAMVAIRPTRMARGLTWDVFRVRPLHCRHRKRAASVGWMIARRREAGGQPTPMKSSP